MEIFPTVLAPLSHFLKWGVLELGEALSLKCKVSVTEEIQASPTPQTTGVKGQWGLKKHVSYTC